MGTQTNGGRPGKLRAMAEIGGGAALLGVGVVASALPVVPGWLFAMSGLVLLACWFRPIRAVVSWMFGRTFVLGLVSAVVDNDLTRRFVSRLMSTSAARRAIDRAVRWKLLNTMLARRAAEANPAWVGPPQPDAHPSVDEPRQEPIFGLR